MTIPGMKVYPANIYHELQSKHYERTIKQLETTLEKIRKEMKNPSAPPGATQVQHS